MLSHHNDESRHLAWIETAKKINRKDPEELVRCICLCPDTMRNSKLFIFLVGNMYANYMLALHGMDKQYNVGRDFSPKILSLNHLYTTTIYDLSNDVLSKY